VATNSAAIIALEFIFLALVLLVLLYAAWIGIVMAKKYTRGVAVAQATARLAPSSGGPPKGAN
jgi:hypothetical protein